MNGITSHGIVALYIENWWRSTGHFAKVVPQLLLLLLLLLLSLLLLATRAASAFFTSTRWWCTG